MSAVTLIERVIATDLLAGDLTTVPARGATDAEISHEESALGCKLLADHSAILRRWNGIDLDVIRFYGCGDATEEIGRLSEYQLDVDYPVDQARVIGADPSGFVYVQAGDGRVFSLDTDGGDFELLSASLDDFVERVIFGPDAASFAGEDWLDELRDAGLVE